jgi:microcystin-dependent protein
MAQGQILDLAEYSLLAEALDYTTFADAVFLPDMRGRVPVGYDAADVDFSPVSREGGEKTHTLTVDEMPAHSHPFTSQNGTPFDQVFRGAPPATTSGLAAATGGDLYASLVVNPVGGGQPHNNVQPIQVVNFSIAMDGLFPSRN